MRAAPLIAIAPLLLVAACGGSSHPAAPPVSTVTVTTTPPTSGTPTTATTSSTPATTSTSASARPHACLTSGLSVHLGASQGSAGHVNEPIVFTNTGSSACTLYGYPGVSFVAPGSGHQVGAAAKRNAQHPPAAVTLAVGASASALLQIANYHDYPPADCQAVPVSGLRVYPPGNRAAAYVAFSSASTACSSQVDQLMVQATVSGSTGM